MVNSRWLQHAANRPVPPLACRCCGAVCMIDQVAFAIINPERNLVDIIKTVHLQMVVLAIEVRCKQGWHKRRILNKDDKASHGTATYTVADHYRVFRAGHWSSNRIRDVVATETCCRLPMVGSSASDLRIQLDTLPLQYLVRSFTGQ